MIKRLFDHKIWIILVAVIAVLILTILAAGLENIDFQPSRPISQGESANIQISVAKISEDLAGIPFWKQATFVGMVFILTVIFALMLSPELRKRIILFILRFSILVLVLLLIFRNSHAFINTQETGAGNTAGGLPLPGEEIEPSIFTPPQLSSTFLFLVSLGVVLLLALAIFLISRWWLRRKRLQKPASPLVELANIARSSLTEITLGRNWEDAIIKCYTRMNEVVGIQRGLHRRKDLTASEFAIRLEEAGLPGVAVQRMTRLFEAARYGVRTTSREEVDEAMSCLTNIMHACGVYE
jgi:hypothetical protein